MIVCVKCQTCQGVSQYGECSTNSACGCFHTKATEGSGICAFLWLTCSQLISCEPLNNVCYQPGHVCVHHSRCFNHPVCYPLSMTEPICPPIPSLPLRPGDGICANATWAKNATTIAGGNGQGSQLNQFDRPHGLFLDDNQNLYVADSVNDRIVKWGRNVSSGQLVAGGNGRGNDSNQLNFPLDVSVDTNGTMYISDRGNERVQRWSLGARNGQTIIDDIFVFGIVQDDQGSPYTSDLRKNEVKKWRIGEMIGQSITSEVQFPGLLFADRYRSIYISDVFNDRVIKVDDQTTQISVVAGGSRGDGANQFYFPSGVAVDGLGTVYVADSYNNRVMRWPHGATFGTVIAGGRGQGSRSDQLDNPIGILFDLDGNLYVVDQNNNRVQKFDIDNNSC
ncbi:unnamed protein product [Rotaria sordida]|uniref:Uncharacterized protein n=1 Tax=Rotaria sordida TaxID=392033 RepID=A0A814AMB1_9BILA|nr:unnamed protein product [Rotaria sordida]CAF3828204.1 unnamed protein product [Rotaria sordida]CAF3910027.1 unnamed protein product [Rotaria sordida]